MSETAESRRLSLGIDRRTLLGSGGLAALTALSGSPVRAGSIPATREAGAIYRALGVRPLINCKGTFTIISGSQSLPEVKEAMFEASRAFVHIDELMEAVSRRLAELTGAEWGIVTNGCSAAATLAACACIAGGDPEKIQRLPELAGLKDEVLAPAYSRNVYDHAVRMVGVRILTAKTPEEFERALGPRTAMAYVLACPDDQGPLGLEAVARMAHSAGVPVLVDAAAENLTPEIHLRRGADLVAYSGGKALRGPQSGGLLLGRKDLCLAAWMNSAPHHAFGRSLKVGKEEIMGMLAAVEAWYRRDHQKEWKTWESWLETIAAKVKAVAGVQTRIILPESLSNNAPRLRISFDGCRIGLSGNEMFRLLLEGEPRIILAGSKGTYRECMGGTVENWVEIMPWMMQEQDAGIVAERLHTLLTKPPRIDRPEPPAGVPAEVSGSWDLDLTFVRGTASHSLFIEQKDGRLQGTHWSGTLAGKVTGEIQGNKIRFQSAQRYEGSDFHFSFTGDVSGPSMSGTVELGEYGTATWTAQRRSA